MESNSLMYTTRTGRVTRKRSYTLNRTLDRSKVKKRKLKDTVSFSNAEMDELQQLREQRQNLDAQRAELDMLRANLAAQQQELQQARQAINDGGQHQQQIEQLRNQLLAQQQELEQARRNQQQLQQPQANAGQQPPQQLQVNAREQPQRNDYAVEMCAILGNMHTGQLDIKIPEFKDENSGNPLEFLDDVTRFCQIKNINDERKVIILSVMLQGNARIWFELQSSFHKFDEFKRSFSRHWRVDFWYLKIKASVPNSIS